MFRGQLSVECDDVVQSFFLTLPLNDADDDVSDVDADVDGSDADVNDDNYDVGDNYNV